MIKTYPGDGFFTGVKAQAASMLSKSNNCALSQYCLEHSSKALLPKQSSISQNGSRQYRDCKLSFLVSHQWPPSPTSSPATNPSIRCRVMLCTSGAAFVSPSPPFLGRTSDMLDLAHFFTSLIKFRIENFRVWDTEWEIPIPGKGGKRDYETIQHAWSV